MAILPIIKGEDSAVLRTKTQKMPQVTKEVLRLIKDMQQTVKKAEGAGLAAPQVGKSLRLCLCMVEGTMTPMINPEITWKSKDVWEYEEGCLSLPNTWVNVTRPVTIRIKYLDKKGNEQERELMEMNARVVQHEIDHLDGVLIVDYAET
ncbi:MAG: peptide deformylase [bacterium]|nr:peptide deformylase [bacterium]